MLERVEKSGGQEVVLVEQLVNPLDLLVKQKVSKAYSSLLSIFQSLAGAGSLSFNHKLLFLDIALKLIDSDNEMIPIRILQVLLILTTRDDVGRPPMANKILQLCLKAFTSKNPSIKSNVFVLLRQMTTLLFGEYSKDNNLQNVCFDIIDQLIIVAGDKYKQIRFKCLSMDLLTVILAEGKETLRKSVQIVELLENAYTPWLKNYLVHEIESYPVVFRVVKSVTQLMLTVRKSYILIQPMIAMASSMHSWHRYLVLESFCALFGNYEQILLISTITNEITNQSVIFYVIC